MIISHKNKFIFIHNYKVAGTSVREALSGYGNKSFLASNTRDKLKFISGSFPRVYSNQFEHHIKANELKSKIPSTIFKEYFKFGFVRNPWDWQVSLYKFMIKRKTHHQHQLIKSMKNFDEYIDWRVHNELRLQKEFFYDRDTCLMDYIGKMENLNNDFSIICNKIGVKSELTHLNSSRTVEDSFLNYYSQETINLVDEAFKEDIKLFGYSKPTL